MKVKLHLLPSVMIFLMVAISSCATQYPKFAGHYRLKPGNNATTSSNVHRVEPSKTNSKLLALSGNNVVVPNINLQPEVTMLPVSVPASTHKVKVHKALVRTSSASETITAHKNIQYSFAVQNSTATHPYYYHDGGSNHLLVRGLIFILIGLLLDGFWFLPPLGFLLGIVGIICIIYGIVLILESL